MAFLVDQDTLLRDFYYYYKPEKKPAATRPSGGNASGNNLTPLTEAEKSTYAGKYYYELTFSNKGGLVMPLIIQWNYADGSSEVERISAYIWRKNESKVVKSFAKNKQVTSIVLDPFKETADIDESNQRWPSAAAPTKVELFKARQMSRRASNNRNNPMQQAKKGG